MKPYIFDNADAMRVTPKQASAMRARCNATNRCGMH